MRASVRSVSMITSEEIPLEADIYMTDSEIHDRLRRMGGVSQGNIEKIAQLNGVTPLMMANHLGFEKLKDAPLFSFEKAELFKAYKKGLTDRELAEKFETNRWRIREWRRENNLAKNAYLERKRP